MLSVIASILTVEHCGLFLNGHNLKNTMSIDSAYISLL